VREANKILAATSDCNALYCALDPREGAKIAVAEAARNLACSGAKPLAVTDNLNFGNPYKPENFWQLRESVEGLAEACREFNTPVTGGNVSLYNQSPAGAVDPTPTVGMVGLIEQAAHITTQAFKGAGDAILLLGDPGDELGGSHYVKVIHGRKAGTPPRLDYTKEKAVQEAVRSLIRMSLVRSAHDCSEGGLAVALAECCISGAEAVGAEIDLSEFGAGPADELLFNEAQSRIVISVRRENAAAALALAQWQGVPAQRLGFTGGEHLRIKAGERQWPWLVKDLKERWWGAIAACMEE